MQKIAIAGYGTVGGGVAEILRRNAAKIAESAESLSNSNTFLSGEIFPATRLKRKWCGTFP